MGGPRSLSGLGPKTSARHGEKAGHRQARGLGSLTEENLRLHRSHAAGRHLFGYFKYVLIAGIVVAVIAVGFGVSASDLSADFGITRCRRSIAKDFYLAPARSTRIGPFLLRSDRATDHLCSSRARASARSCWRSGFIVPRVCQWPA